VYQGGQTKPARLPTVEPEVMGCGASKHSHPRPMVAKAGTVMKLESRQCWFHRLPYRQDS
jgi:hypothetical protein